MNDPRYAVRRCRSASNDERYGPTHMSESGAMTLCGREIDAGWWIEHQTGDGVDCKKCLRVSGGINVAPDQPAP